MTCKVHTEQRIGKFVMCFVEKGDFLARSQVRCEEHLCSREAIDEWNCLKFIKFEAINRYNRLMHCWQLDNWPDFFFDRGQLDPLLREIEEQLNPLMQRVMDLPEVDRQDYLLEIMVEEAKNTSSIEGEFMSREDIRSSILNHWRLGYTKLNVIDKRAVGVSKLMSAVATNFQLPIKEATLKYWHTLLFADTAILRSVGDYRLGPDPMQIISGPLHNLTVHYEAPPADWLAAEMQSFIKSLDRSYSENRLINGLIKAGIAHLYFESIHPFEDGNGRIGRALIDYMLSQTIGYMAPFSVSQSLQLRQKDYYAALNSARKDLDATYWLQFYLESLSMSIKLARQYVEHVLTKARIFDKFGPLISQSQRKVLVRLFDAGPEGFVGGLSAKNYVSITRVSRATASRELSQLVALSVLTRSGAGRGVRYALNLTGE